MHKKIVPGLMSGIWVKGEAQSHQGVKVSHDVEKMSRGGKVLTKAKGLLHSKPSYCEATLDVPRQ